MMRIFAAASCFTLLLTTVFVAMGDDAPSADAKKTFRFFLKPNDSQDRLLAVPASKGEKLPANCTAVTCESLRFERNGIVFVNVTMESEEDCITASEMTVQLDKVSGLDVSWDVSDDFKMRFKTAEAKQRFLQTH